MKTNYVLAVEKYRLDVVPDYKDKLFKYVNNHTASFNRSNVLDDILIHALNDSIVYLKFELPVTFAGAFIHRIERFLNDNKIPFRKVEHQLEPLSDNLYLNRGKLYGLSDVRKSSTLRHVNLESNPVLMVLDTRHTKGTNLLQLTNIHIVGESCEVTNIYSLLRYRLTPDMNKGFDSTLWSDLVSRHKRSRVVGICNNRAIDLITLEYIDEYPNHATLVEGMLYLDLKLTTLKDHLICYKNLTPFELMSFNLLKAEASLDEHYTSFRWV